MYFDSHMPTLTSPELEATSRRPDETPIGDPDLETQRLKALHQLNILDTPAEPEFDELVQLAAAICEAPICMISLIDESRQWFKAAVGIEELGTSRDIAFCHHTIKTHGVLLVEDATTDPRFSANPLVTGESHYRFYAGMPVTTTEGFAVGTLCVLDRVPRRLTPSQINALEVLGHQVNARLELREQRIALEKALQATEAARAELAASDTRFQAFMDSAPFMSYIKDADGRFLFYNRRVSEHFNISREAWLGKTVEDLFPPEQANSYRRNDLRVMDHGTLLIVEETVKADDGTCTYWNSYKFPCGDNRHFLLGGISVDITDEIRKQDQLHVYRQELEYANTLLRQQATTDSLTGLPNRRAVQERLAHDFALARRNHSPLSVLLLDVDDFKRCNDTHGHEAGDRTLCHLANILRQTVRQTDLIARYGGEEFLLILPETNASDALVLANRILSSLASTTWPAAPTTISGGVASLLPEITTQERLISLADEALYRAKHYGKNRVVACDESASKPPGV
jgi:diguanylate cyclase (GGDEF)-like protein/PAS domain S-box-containing protein